MLAERRAAGAADPGASAPGRRPAAGAADPRCDEAEYRAPLWQHGAKPYASEGGGFVFEGDAPVQATSDEVMRLAISIPQGEPPERGWPVVIYHHGTGGSYRSFLESSGSFAQDLNRQGLAMIGLDQPLHGLRAVAGTNTEWHTFNPFNLEASAANLRQGALDLLLLHRMIQEGALNSAEPRIALDPQRIFLFGHSQGGLTGALALPELAELPCAIMSGTGGALSLTLLERKDPINIAEALAGWGGAQNAALCEPPPDQPDPARLRTQRPYHRGASLADKRSAPSAPHLRAAGSTDPCFDRRCACDGGAHPPDRAHRQRPLAPRA